MYSTVKGPVKSKKVIAVLLVLGQRVFHWLNIAVFVYKLPDTDPRFEAFSAAAMEFAERVEGFHRATEIFYQYLEQGEKQFLESDDAYFMQMDPRRGEGPEFEDVGMFMRWFGSPESMWYHRTRIMNCTLINPRSNPTLQSFFPAAPVTAC